MTNSLKETNAEIQKVTLLGSLIDLLLGILKIVSGNIFLSQALIVDGIHSLTDIVTDIFVLFIAKASYQEPDEDHPYGHYRYETIGTIILGGILIGVAGALAYDNTIRLITREASVKPNLLAMLVAIISIISKEWVYRFSMKLGKKLNSNLLMANAWHSRTDAFSSVVVLIGLLLSYTGNYWFDNLAAIGVALIIGKVGLDFIIDSIKEIAETGVPAKDIKKFSEVINSIEEVKNFHNLRSRTVGSKVILDVNIEVSPSLTVSEGHQIASWVAKLLIQNFDEVIDVTVHTDVENDMLGPYKSNNLDLLPRPLEIKTLIKEKLSTIIDTTLIRDIRLHYHRGTIDVEIFSDEKSQKIPKEDVENLLKEFTWFSSLHLWYDN